MRFIVASLLAFTLAPGPRLCRRGHCHRSGRPVTARASTCPRRFTWRAMTGATMFRPFEWGPCGPQAVAADGKTDNRAHGFVEGGVGTSGYRHVAAGVCKPLANGGSVSVSVSGHPATRAAFRTLGLGGRFSGRPRRPLPPAHCRRRPRQHGVDLGDFVAGRDAASVDVMTWHDHRPRVAGRVAESGAPADAGGISSVARPPVTKATVC